MTSKIKEKEFLMGDDLNPLGCSESTIDGVFAKRLHSCSVKTPRRVQMTGGYGY